MDDYGCMNGFLSTYDQTIIMRRTGPYTFKRSPVIYHTTSSSARAVSVRECMVYLARLARGGRWRYHGQRIGPIVTACALAAAPWKMQKTRMMRWNRIMAHNHNI